MATSLAREDADMIVPPEIDEYATAHTSPESGFLARVAEATRAATTAPTMMVGPLEGGLLELLVWLLAPTTVVEIGTFTGYSALSMAAALPPHGRLVTCEIDDAHAELAARHFADSPLGPRIDLRRGPALATLASLDGPIDLAFVDADKGGYAAYYEALLPKLADGGLIVVDNVLWRGTVLDPPADDPDAVALAAFNDMVVADPRVRTVMLTVRDGVSLLRRA